MAIPVGFEGCNSLLTAPTGQEHDVGDLPTFVCGEINCVTSCWRLSEEELAEVAATGVVWFRAAGRTHPPVQVSGQALVLIDGKPAKAEPVLTRIK